MESDHAWQIFGQINEWIRFADTKATAVLATAGVLGGLLVSHTPPAQATVRAILLLTIFVLAVMTIGASAALSLAAMLPRLAKRTDPASMIYFEHIARRHPADPVGYTAALTKLSADPEAIQRELATQIWSNSIVARRKFSLVTAATWLLGAAMFCSAIVAVLRSS